MSNVSSTGLYDPKICGLIGIGLDCNPLLGGISGLGVSALQNFLHICNWSCFSGLYLKIATKLASKKKGKKDPHVLLCLVNSIIYEKTISEVEKYNEAFAAATTEVFDGPTMNINTTKQH